MDLYQFKDYALSVGRQGFNMIHYVHILRPVHSMFLRTKLCADPRKDKNCLFCRVCNHFQVFFPGIGQLRNANLFKKKYHVLY